MIEIQENHLADKRKHKRRAEDQTKWSQWSLVMLAFFVAGALTNMVITSAVNKYAPTVVYVPVKDHRFR